MAYKIIMSLFIIMIEKMFPCKVVIGILTVGLPIFTIVVFFQREKKRFEREGNKPFTRL